MSIFSFRNSLFLLRIVNCDVTSGMLISSLIRKMSALTFRPTFNGSNR